MEVAPETPQADQAQAPHSLEQEKEQTPRHTTEPHPMPVQAALEIATATEVACREFQFPAATT